MDLYRIQASIDPDIHMAQQQISFYVVAPDMVAAIKKFESKYQGRVTQKIDLICSDIVL